jgi:GNAT superfamily N-acetyltransferase
VTRIGWRPWICKSSSFLTVAAIPFYQHGEAEAYLAKRRGQTVGRILVSDDSRYNQVHGSNAGCFGLLDVIDDPRVCRSLLDAATRWLLARGRTEILGPIDYSTNYPCGLLVDGFNSSPSVMMNHHPEYYQRLLAGCGLTKAKDLYAWWFDTENQLDATWRQRVGKISSRYRVKVRPISFRDYDAEIARCKAIYNESFEANWGFVRLTDAEFEHLAKDLKQMAVPQLIQLAEVDGRPVGLSITLPNINEAIQPLRGKLTTAGLPIGLMRLAYRLKKVQTGRLAVLGVVPGYRRRGVAEALIQQTFHQGFGCLGYRGAELGWTLEDNVMVNRMIERVGGRRYKTYRIYRKNLQCSADSETTRSFRMRQTVSSSTPVRQSA